MSPETDDARLFSLELRDIDRNEDNAPGPVEAIVLIEEIMRGGSDSAVSVEVYSGQEGGVCGTPVTLDLSMDLDAPFEIKTFQTDRPGVPGLDIRYRFFASNAYGSYDTTSAYVSDERRERYLPADDHYILDKADIIECIVCAPAKGAD